MAKNVFRQFIELMRQERAEERAKRPKPKLATLPSCIGCGTAVEVKGQLCHACGAKRAINPKGPQPSIVLTPVKAPPYQAPAAPDPDTTEE